MNITELKKEFDEKFPVLRKGVLVADRLYADKDATHYINTEYYNECDTFHKNANPKVIKSFIFNTVIKEVLKEVVPEERKEDLFRNTISNGLIKEIKQKAKEKFNVDI